MAYEKKKKTKKRTPLKKHGDELKKLVNGFGKKKPKARGNIKTGKPKRVK